MKFVNLADARANLEELLAEVERGETLVITCGASSEKTPEETNAAAKQKWLEAMRDLRDLKKGAGIASVDDLLKWREEARLADRLRWKAPRSWTDAAASRTRHSVNSRV